MAHYYCYAVEADVETWLSDYQVEHSVQNRNTLKIGCS
jgi:hypothetical protein